MENRAHQLWKEIDLLRGNKRSNLEEVEFFFYCFRRDDANNLAVDLFKLGYHLYGVFPPGQPGEPWLITGHALIKIRTVGWSKVWIEKMEELAERNEAVFDGMGAEISLPQAFSAR